MRLLVPAMFTAYCTLSLFTAALHAKNDSEISFSEESEESDEESLSHGGLSQLLHRLKEKGHPLDYVHLSEDQRWKVRHCAGFLLRDYITVDNVLKLEDMQVWNLRVTRKLIYQDLLEVKQALELSLVQLMNLRLMESLIVAGYCKIADVLELNEKQGQKLASFEEAITAHRIAAHEALAKAQQVMGQSFQDSSEFSSEI